MNSNIYDLHNIWTVDKKCWIFLSPATPCYLNVTLLGFQSVQFPSDMRHYTQEKSFLTLRDKKLLKLENLILDQ